MNENPPPPSIRPPRQMKKAFIFLLGVAALSFVRFPLVVAIEFLSRPGRARMNHWDHWDLVLLGVMLTLSIGGASLMIAVTRAWRLRDWTPGKWTRLAFSLVVLDLAVILVSPYFMKARLRLPHPPCYGYKRQIHGAKQGWALDNRKGTNDIPTKADLVPYFKDNQFPVCGQGGIYIIGTVAENGPAPTIRKNVSPTGTEREWNPIC